MSKLLKALKSVEQKSVINENNVNSQPKTQQFNGSKLFNLLAALMIVTLGYWLLSEPLEQLRAFQSSLPTLKQQTEPVTQISNAKYSEIQSILYFENDQNASRVKYSNRMYKIGDTLPNNFELVRIESRHIYVETDNGVIQLPK